MIVVLLKSKRKPMHVTKYYTYKKNIVDINLEDRVVVRRCVLLGRRIVVNDS